MVHTLQTSSDSSVVPMECQKQKKRKCILTYFFYGYSFLYCISINIFKFLVDYLHAIHIFILHYMVIHFLYCISINIFKFLACHTYIFILYIFIAYDAICITSALLYYMQVLLHMLLVYFLHPTVNGDSCPILRCYAFLWLS